MIFIEALQTGVMATIFAFLSVSNGVAGIVDTTFFADAGPSPTVVREEGGPAGLLSNLQQLSVRLTELPSKDTKESTLRDVLRKSAAYQKAAVITATDEGQSPDTTHTSASTKKQITRALVNVYCSYRYDGYVRTITGSGFFIDDDGVVLTNAHVAQFLLLEAADIVKDAQCVLRTGSPAEPRYEVELLYISPLWISSNASLVDAAEPKGTGERDYALLYVSGAVGGDTLPEQFPTLPVDTTPIGADAVGEQVFAGGFPVDPQELKRNDQKDLILYPVVATTSIDKLYTFDTDTVDIVTIGNSSVGKHGSSGGVVASDAGVAMGLIATKGDVTTEGETSLRALTLSYINRTITEETGFSLYENIQGDVVHRSAVFKRVLAPFLSDMLVHSIQ